LSDFDPPSPTKTYITPLKGPLTLHVRRGDYEFWCNDAYNNAVSFTGFNSFSELPHKYLPPERNGSERTCEITRKYCLPSIPDIVEKVLTINAPHISCVYVMTKAPRPWLAELKAALRSAHDWLGGVGMSRDLRLS
jgi:hypothetical protein